VQSHHEKLWENTKFLRWHIIYNIPAVTYVNETPWHEIFCFTRKFLMKSCSWVLIFVLKSYPSLESTKLVALFSCILIAYLLYKTVLPFDLYTSSLAKFIFETPHRAKNASAFCMTSLILVQRKISAYLKANLLPMKPNLSQKCWHESNLFVTLSDSYINSSYQPFLLMA